MLGFFRGVGAMGGFFSQLWGVLAPYWKSEERRVAWLLLSVTVIITVITVYIGVVTSFIYRDFFSAMQNLDQDAFFGALYWILGYLAIQAAIEYVKTHASLSLIIRWRRWLTINYVDRYLADSTFYQLELKNYGIDNPDQRLSEDFRNITKETLDLLLEILRTVLNLVSFSAILWAVSGTLDTSIFGFDVAIPGYMFWVAIAFAGFGTWAAHMIAHPLTKVNHDLQAVEADFRFQLVRLRENAESIALSRGQRSEKAGLAYRFSHIWDNWYDYIKYTKRLFTFRTLFLSSSSIFPTVVASPKFFSRQIDFGELMQLGQAFAQVENALAWFMNAYDRIAAWKASANRLLAMQEAMDAVDADRKASRLRQKEPASGVEDITLTGVDLSLPNGEPLLENVDLTLSEGSHALIQGQSGSGKSTFFRMLAGLWPWADGDVNLRAKDAMFVPQQIFLPNGPLINAIAYPDLPDEIDRAEVLRLMKVCQLEDLTDSLDQTDNWSQTLSGGEKQRFGMLRAMLQKPRWLFLDEASSAMDPNMERALYTAVMDELSDTTVVSIAHRESLRPFHDRVYNVNPKTKSLELNTGPEQLPAE